MDADANLHRANEFQAIYIGECLDSTTISAHNVQRQQLMEQSDRLHAERKSLLDINQAVHERVASLRASMQRIRMEREALRIEVEELRRRNEKLSREKNKPTIFSPNPDTTK